MPQAKSAKSATGSRGKRKRPGKSARAPGAANSPPSLERIIDQMDQGIIALDAELRITAVNRRARTLLDTPARLLRPGIDFAQVIRHAAERGDYGPGKPAAHVKRLLALFDEHEAGQLERTLPDGSVIEVRRHAMAEGGFVITYTNITQRVRAEQASRERSAIVRLLQVVAMAANKAETTEDVMQVCIDQVCAHTGWPVGHVYVTDPADEMLLVPTKLWHLANPRKFSAFRKITEATSFASGKGMPGRVLASGAPVWIMDVTEDRNFPRAKQARDIGVKTGLAFPVLVDGKVAAVLEFFSDRPAAPDAALLELLGHVGEQLGRVIERKRIEKARHESEERYRGLVELSQELIMVLRDEQIAFINLAGTAMLGADDPADLAGASIYDIIHPDYHQQARARIRKMLGGGRAVPTMHQRYLRTDGAAIDVEVTSTPFVHRDGPSVLVVARDITERLKAERALKASEERFRAVVDNSPTKIHIKDADGRYVLLNRLAERLFGVTDEEARGKTTDDIFPNRMAGQFKAHDKAVLETGETIEGEEEFVLDDGVHTFLTVKFPIPDASGKIVGVGAIGTDITERKKVEEALRAAKDELERASQAKDAVLGEFNAVIDTIEQGVVFMDSSLRARIVNRAFREMWSLPEEFTLGLPTMGELMEHNRRNRLYDVPDDEWEDFKEARIEAVRNGDIAPMEMRRADGKVLQYQCIALPHGDRMMTYFDITASKEKEEQLRAAAEQTAQASRAKSDFLANMSHELRTPLNAIIGFSEIMAGELLGPIGSQTYREYAEDIRHSGIHLLSLINDILDLSKIEAGKLKLDLKELDVAEIVEFSARIVREHAEKANLALEIRMADGLPSIYADGRALKQILLNLLSNAIKFTPEGGRIVIAGEIDPDGCFVLSVTDSGIGIAGADVETALAPFGQIAGALTRKHTGTGLGLPLVRSLVELHGGTLGLTSNPGAGTRVAVIFPKQINRYPRAARAAPMKAAAGAGSSG